VLPPHDIAKTSDLQQTMSAQELLAWHQPALSAKTSMRRFAFLSHLLISSLLRGGGGGGEGENKQMMLTAPTTGLQTVMMS